jgi:acetyl esterase/lipase
LSRSRAGKRAARRVALDQLNASRAYLLASLVGLWFTKQALWPAQLPKLRALPSFFAGWLTNELAFHHLAWQAGVSAVAVRKGALQRRSGRVALGLTVVQIAGMAVLIRRIFASRDALQEALDEALAGFPGPLEEIEPEDSRAMRWGELVIPFPPRHPDVDRRRRIRFARDSGVDLHLDVYRHHSLPQRRPVILYIHGGAWMISSRDEQGLPLMHEMAARGWTGVNADYRLSPMATFPDHLIDVKRAIAWIRSNADEIGADPDFIAIAGGSAGGHLAALAALTPNDPQFQPGFEDVDTTVQACVPFYGVYDFTDADHPGGERWADIVARYIMKATVEDDPGLYKAASPIAHVHRDAPPFFIVHGEFDTLVPAGSARRFADALRAIAKAPVGYAELPGTQHAFDVFPSLRTAYVLDGIARFLQRAYRVSRTVPGWIPEPRVRSGGRG